MSCRECVHLHIVNGRIVYARCVLGKAVFEKYGAGRLLLSKHSCAEEDSRIVGLKRQDPTQVKVISVERREK